MGKDSLPGYGPVILMNRPVRTRTQGGVGAGGERPPATRLEVSFFYFNFWDYEWSSFFII